mgnify:CR=1 FL=1
MFPQAFYIGNTMISKILSIIKSKFKKTKPNIEKSSPLLSEGGYFLDNPCCRFTIEVDEEGDFVIDFDSANTAIEPVGAVGNLIFLINSGALATFFVKAIEIWVAEAEGKEKEEREAFSALVFAQWNETYMEHQNALEDAEQNNSESAIDPSRVFNLRKYL